MIPGTTPGDPADTGAADPTLRAALSAGDTAGVRVAILRARLLLPVVALRNDGEADMALPALIAADGRRALPVFSSYAALRSWRAEARPVPMWGARLLVGAADEGYAAVVLDVAGPIAHTVAADDLRVLADAARALLADPALSVAVVDATAAEFGC
jgi:hypothetical protein